MVNAKLRPLYPQKRDQVPILQRSCRLHVQSRRVRIISPLPEFDPRTACGEILHRLPYSGLLPAQKRNVFYVAIKGSEYTIHTVEMRDIPKMRQITHRDINSCIYVLLGDGASGNLLKFVYDVATLRKNLVCMLPT